MDKVILTEDHINPDAAEVYYQTPDDLKIGTSSAEPKVVVHDDENPVNHGVIPEIDNSPTVPEVDIPSDTDPIDHTPVDIAKMDPESIPVVAFAGNDDYDDDRVFEFYVDADDVMHYASLTEKSMISALNDIVTCNEDTGVSAQNLRIVVSESTIGEVTSLEEAGATCIRFVTEDNDIAMDVEVGPNGNEVRVAEDPQAANPVDVVKRQYDNVIVAKQGSEFFTDVEDVQKCADIRHESVIETLNGIIACNEDAGVSARNFVCIIGEGVRHDTINELAEAGVKTIFKGI